MHRYSSDAAGFSLVDDYGYFDGGVQFNERLSVSGDGELRFGVDGELSWSRPYTEVFGAGADTGEGWNWHDPVSEGGPLVLTGFSAAAEDIDLDKPQVIEQELARGTTVSLARASGETEWTIEAQPCLSTEYELRVTDDVVALCQFQSGSLRAEWDGTTVTEIDYLEVDVDLVGVDKQSGELRWRESLGDPRWGAGSDGTQQYRAASDHIVAMADDGVRVIDVASGAARLLKPGQSLLCASDAGEVVLDSVWSNGTYPLADAYGLCDEKGPRLDDALPAPPRS